MKAARSAEDEVLLEQFVATFHRFGDTVLFADLDPAAVPLAAGPVDELGFQHWAPRAVDTPRSVLPRLYEKLPARFPPLYEQLILSYRWAEVDLNLVTLLANPMGPDLSGLRQEIFNDPGLIEILVPNALLQLGKPGGGHYDPICFDARARRNDGDGPIVRVDHEEILCHRRLEVLEEIAPSFRALVGMIIARAAEMP
jgi:hypothetical protein